MNHRVLGPEAAVSVDQSVQPAEPVEHRRSRLGRVAWAVASYSIAGLPLPLYATFVALVALAIAIGRLPEDMIGGIAVMMLIGLPLGQFGTKVPILRSIGGPAILALFVPSFLVFHGLLGPSVVNATKSFMTRSNFLYFYISCLVTGSILGTDRRLLVQGFVRMFVPLALGTAASVAVGVSVGTLGGLGFEHSLFFVVVPILSGGVGEGILPLSMGYSEILKAPVGQFVPELMPAAMIGNITAIMSAGLLHRLGQRRRNLSGAGQLVKSGEAAEVGAAPLVETSVDMALMGVGLLTACCFFIFGGVVAAATGFPGPIVMIGATAIAKVAGVLSPLVEKGAYQHYRFIATTMTWPLVAGVGIVLTPWEQIVAVVSLAYVATCVSTVLAMVGTGFCVARFVKMYPIEAAIVTGCHSGLGGTGDIAILSAANRMELLPFAQVSTRIGGACTVIAAIMLLRLLH